MSDAAEIVAIDVFSRPRGRPASPNTMAFMKQKIDELLAHPPECLCGRSEAAAVARVGHVWRMATAWERSTAATERRAAR